MPYGRGFSNNADMFSKLGDPWVSEREQMSDYNRREWEDPDLDQFTRATRAKRPLDGIAMDIKRIDIHKRNEHADVTAAKKKEDARLLRQRKIAGVLNRMNAKMRGETR